MSALADELMADLDGLSDAGDDYNDDEPEQGGPSNGLKGKATGDDGAMSEDNEEENGGEAEGTSGLVLDGGVNPAEELDAEEVQRMELGGVDDVRTVARLEGSRRMAEILGVRSLVPGSMLTLTPSLLRKLKSTRPTRRRQKRCPCRCTLTLSITSSFRQITSPSMLTTRFLSSTRQVSALLFGSPSIDLGPCFLLQFIRDHYAPKFPELERLITDPNMYVKAVRKLANDEVRS
jgi:U4/U6 small nuclear ribonucleoprotein PRP31